MCGLACQRVSRQFGILKGSKLPAFFVLCQGGNVVNKFNPTLQLTCPAEGAAKGSNGRSAPQPFSHGNNNGKDQCGNSTVEKEPPLKKPNGHNFPRPWGQLDLVDLRAELQKTYGFCDILSKNPRMLAVFRLINDLALAKASVLIEGETGTGKEQVARAIHKIGNRRSGPFVAVNCAGLPENLLESELFGHEKGAFTSSIAQRRGRFELAQGGTIFLDEVGDMPASMQAKLLRVLQERNFERVGGIDTIQLDVRVIAATNRSLSNMVKDGKFREDLFYRLNVVKISLPSLSERTEDIPLLIAHFIAKHASQGEGDKSMSNEALETILRHSWPGNIRELENAIERACVTARGRPIQIDDLPRELGSSTAPFLTNSIDLNRPLTDLVREAVAQYERRYLQKALELTRGHVGKCARMCGWSRRCTSSRIAEFQLDRLEFKAD